MKFHPIARTTATLLRSFLIAMLWLALAPHAFADAPAVPEGKSQFAFTDAKGDPTRTIPVYTYLPRGVDPVTARIVFVMHGVTKDAEGYRDTWIALADRYRFLIVAPLFDSGQWGGGEYSHGNVFTRSGELNDPSLWSFSVIEHLFDALKTATGNTTARYFLYGHSEGGQFVHRLVLFLPDARYEKAVAANAGWYTMPTADVAFPFGLAGSPLDDASLAKSFGRDLVVLLGDRDVDPNHYQLNRTPPAMAQGINRWQRGHAFVVAAEARAKQMNVPLAWQLKVVHGAAHQNGKMSGPAASLFADS